MERSFISCQRKDGRYAYKYMDANGKPQFVYVWKLTAED
ncbi:integrase DNA-binding domain-containing protein [Anaerostipes hominis (ex Lee et al. 2021)]